MSWSNRWIGKPEAIVRAMDRYETQLTGNSLEEFQRAKPCLATLVLINDDQNVVDLDASGSAWNTTSTCNVTLRKIGTLCE